MSATATLIGLSALISSFHDMLPLIGVLMSFILGSSIAGFLLNDLSLKFGRHYDSVLLLESVLLALALGFLENDLSYGHLFSSAACGLQNAMATTHRGAIIRTTHVTGILTDLGIMLGVLFKGKKIDTRKAKLFIIIVTGFIIGGVLGSYFFCCISIRFTGYPSGYLINNGDIISYLFCITTKLRLRSNRTWLT